MAGTRMSLSGSPIPASSPSWAAIQNRARHPRAVATGIEVLRRRIARIALAGRLKVTERQAIDLFRSMGMGTILTLLRQAPAERDPTLSERAREAVVAAIVTAVPVVDRAGPATAAITLRAALSIGYLAQRQRAEPPGRTTAWIGPAGPA